MIKPPSKRERKHSHAKTRAQFNCLDCVLETISVHSQDTILLSLKDGSATPDVGFLQGILSILELKGITGIDILLLPKGAELSTLSAEKFESLAEAKGYVKITDNENAIGQPESAALNADGRTQPAEGLQAESRSSEYESRTAP